MSSLEDVVLLSLDDDDAKVRYSTLRLLLRLDPDVLAKYIDRAIVPIITCVDDISPRECLVRIAAIDVLAKLNPEVLSNYADRIFAMLEVDDFCSRYSAMQAVAKLAKHSPLVIAQNVRCIIDQLDHDYVEPRHRLERPTAQLLSEMQDCMNYPTKYRRAAAQVLVEMQPDLILKHLDSIMVKMSSDACEKKEAIKALVARARWVQARRLFWASRLLWWWSSLPWRPGSRQARAAAVAFGEMQGGREGVSVGAEAPRVKRVRAA